MSFVNHMPDSRRRHSKMLTDRELVFIPENSPSISMHQKPPCLILNQAHETRNTLGADNRTLRMYPHGNLYATSTSSSPCTFVRAMSVACAQLPRNTTVTRPCVLLPVGS